MTLEAINDLSRDRFTAALGWVFEHSPWVAERAWARRPFATFEALHEAMVDQVTVASHREQLALLRAHPDLGARSPMSGASDSEQSGAGLRSQTPEESERLDALNTAYRQKFGFPFILAIKGSTRRSILRALEHRFASDADEEFREALRQVSRIAWFRIEGIAIKAWDFPPPDAPSQPDS